MIKAQSLVSIRSTRSILDHHADGSSIRSEHARTTVLSPTQKLQAQHDLQRLKRTSVDIQAKERRIWWDEQRHVKQGSVQSEKDIELQEIAYRAEQWRKELQLQRQRRENDKREEHMRKERQVQAIRVSKDYQKEDESRKSLDDFQRTVRLTQIDKSQFLANVRESHRQRHHHELRENYELLMDKVTAQQRYKRQENSEDRAELYYAEAKGFEEKLTEHEQEVARNSCELETAEKATRPSKTRK